MIQGTSAVTLHAQVVLNVIGCAHVPPAGEIIVWLGIEKDEDGEVHICAEATVDKSNRAGRVQTIPHPLLSIDFKTNTEEPFFVFIALDYFVMIAGCLTISLYLPGEPLPAPTAETYTQFAETLEMGRSPRSEALYEAVQISNLQL